MERERRKKGAKRKERERNGHGDKGNIKKEMFTNWKINCELKFSTFFYI